MTLSLSSYQKAILLAMEIPLYESNAPAFKETTPESEDLADNKLQSAPANSAAAAFAANESSVSKDTAAKNIQAISEVLNTNDSTAPVSKTREHVDERHNLVKQILTLFDVQSLEELGISWLIHDQHSISLQGANLVSMHPDKLRTPKLKKQLWLTIQDFFKPDLWS